MKAKSKYGLTGYTGNVDDMIFYTLPNCDVLIGRRRPGHFTVSEHHKDYKMIAQNLKEINPSSAYREDFKVYTALYKELPEAKKSIAGWYNLYISMLWALQKDGLCDLKTLTREQIYAQHLPCISVRAAVDTGYLPSVLNYELLTNEI
ncbi:MAG TPA: hypothetical protein PLF50_02035 [Candidatus Cloacimonadota bacterium]|nr:hypothetical protein [Candidatus Cloacimonadota bacterium]HOV16267.1 hypothetical protein [Candidatus Cloacimonadota bacterium]HQL14463.1 hypothetical protein [Candidatus Cloacimonadota bacterium]